MFTGIIKALGRVVSLHRAALGAELVLSCPALAAEAPSLGDSIAVNGACLTIKALEGDALSFDLSEETLRRTTLGELRPGQEVNLEPALRAGQPLGGHLVMGHVDATGWVRSLRPQGADFWELQVQAPPELMRYIVPKGSVAVDGVSLTVAQVLQQGFTVALIPHTVRSTTLGRRPPYRVNLEADIIGKYVERLLGMGEGGLLRALKRAGYL